MTDQRRDLIERKVMRIRYLETHLQDTSLIAGRVIGESDLLSIEQTLIFKEMAKEMRSKESNCIEIQLLDICTARFNDFVRKLNKANSNSVYVWLYYTEFLGSFVISSIAEVNFFFDYRKMESGYFIVSTTDGIDSLFFDISIDDGVISIEVCLRGENWSKVSY